MKIPVLIVASIAILCTAGLLTEPYSLEHAAWCIVFLMLARYLADILKEMKS